MKGESARVIARARNREVGTGRPHLPAANMVWIPGGTFLMGSDHLYPEERPAHRVAGDGSWMDKHPVTNAEFRRFVEATRYTTVAERAPNPADYPGVNPSLLVPGSLVRARRQGVGAALMRAAESAAPLEVIFESRFGSSD